MLVSPTGQLHAAHLLDQVLEKRVDHIHSRLKHPHLGGCHLCPPRERQIPSFQSPSTGPIKTASCQAAELAGQVTFAVGHVFMTEQSRTVALRHNP
jgi:hypothetical protein